MLQLRKPAAEFSDGGGEKCLMQGKKTMQRCGSKFSSDFEYVEQFSGCPCPE
jgi:hypothetical protein